jgi:hypothetical protein
MTPPAGGKRTGIDAGNGTLTLDDWDTGIGPQLTRTAFLRAPIGRAAADLVVNEPWHSWQLTSHIGGREFLLGIFFEGETLDMVMLTLQDSCYGTSWEDYSEKKEMERHAAHWRWLRDELDGPGARARPGNERVFPWGSISAEYDPRSGSASIVIGYGRA